MDICVIIIKISFYAISFVFLFTWIFYPIFLYLARFLVQKKTGRLDGSYKPTVSIIIAAHNEEKCIADRIKNLLKLDYPKDNMEIIIASDGSTDKTNEIVSKISLENNQVVLMPFQEQKGRAFVHNKSVEVAKGEIVVFSDAETLFDIDFLKHIMPYFSDPTVGSVSGRIYYKNIKDSSITQSAGIYWKYEELIRKLQSDLGILAFGTAAALAVRKRIYKPIGLSEDIDRVVTLNAVIEGYKVKYETLAKAYDYIEVNAMKTHIRRVRKTLRGFKYILNSLFKINPLKKPMLFGSIFFHKTSRHLTPFYMVFMFALNMILLNSGLLYKAALLLQILFYAFAGIGGVLQLNNRKFILFSIPYNFVLINIGRMCGVAKCIFGSESATYE